MLRLPSLRELDRGLAARVYLSTRPTDMRKGFDSLAALVKDFLGQDPLSGHLFLFIGRARDRLKILYWDAAGFAVSATHCPRDSDSQSVVSLASSARPGGTEFLRPEAKRPRGRSVPSVGGLPWHGGRAPGLDA
jgi:hypothetical protein